MSEQDNNSAIDLATELTIAWLGNQNVRPTAEDVPAFLRTMHTTINELAAGSVEAPGAEADATESNEAYKPAVTVRKSLASRDHIISLIDGKPYKTLRRHLAGHGLTPDDYRARYGLKQDYPMVAPTYSEARKAMAHKIGLGQKGRAARADKASGTAEAKPAGRRRKSAPAE